MLVWQINLCLKLWRKSHAVGRSIAVGIVRVVYKRQGKSPTLSDFSCQVQHVQVVERQGCIWMAGPHVSPDTIPEVGLPDFHFAGSFSELFEAPLHVALDNFSEDEHTPFIHHRLGWTPEQATQVEFETQNYSDHCEVHYRAPQRTNLVYVRRGDCFHNDWKTYFDPPRIHYHLHWTNAARTKHREFELFVLIYFVPETSKTTRVQSILYVKHRRLPKVLRPLTHAVAAWMVKQEVRDDARFIRIVADTPFEMRGMKLCKFDKPLVQNHKLLKKIYWGQLEQDGDDPLANSSQQVRTAPE